MPSHLEFSRDCVMSKTKNMTSESLVSSKRSLVEQSCYAYVVTVVAALMLPRIKEKLAVKVSTNVCYNRAVLDP